MVFYFTSNVVDPPVTLFMGKDKYENEDLIKYGWPEDVWFHVEDMSSAHVYLRLRKGETIQSVPTSVLNDCAQLVKANSISGNKKNNIEVIYTMWSNLQKTEGMDVGQVSFHNRKEVYTIKVEKRINEIVNRLNKTKVEKEPDLRGEREQRDKMERDQVKTKLKNLKLKEKEEEKEKARLAEERTYSSLMKSEKMTSNQEADEDSDDFM